MPLMLLLTLLAAHLLAIIASKDYLLVLVDQAVRFLILVFLYLLQLLFAVFVRVRVLFAALVLLSGCFVNLGSDLALQGVDKL